MRPAYLRSARRACTLLMVILLSVAVAGVAHGTPSSAAGAQAVGEGRFVPSDPTVLLNTATGNGAPQAGKIRRAVRSPSRSWGGQGFPPQVPPRRP